MKKISGRAVITTLLVIAAIVGLIAFTVEYLLQARTWVSFTGSPHVYSSGNISTGTVVDRSGEVLLSNGSSRAYSADVEVREATLHLLGDREGRIEAPLVNTYAEYLLDYNVLNGMYNSSSSGNTLHLTLSSEACVAALEGLGTRKGTIGVYNYLTGEVLCMVSSGTFDPDNPPADDEINTNSYYEGAYLNRFTSVTYVPGSIFKLITSAAAIDNIADVQTRTFDCEQYETIGGEQIVCENYHGAIDFGTGLVKSCNIVFGELAAELGAETLTDYAERAGVTSQLTFDGTTTAAGRFADLTGADLGTVAWTGIGQGETLINPCQFMTFVGSIANGGQAASPYVVDSVQTQEGIKIYSAKTTMLDRTMRATTAGTLSDMMANDVTQNYGTENFPSGITVCAKSGTAEVGNTANAMFAGFVKGTQYPLAFIVVVEGAGDGSSTCVPIISKVLSKCMEAIDQD